MCYQNLLNLTTATIIKAVDKMLNTKKHVSGKAFSLVRPSLCCLIANFLY